MALLSYDKIFESFLRKITDFDIANMPTQLAYSMEIEYLHSAIARPYLRRLFSVFNLDDEVGEINYALKQVTDEIQDEYFIIEAIALGMQIEWIEPQLNSKLLNSQFFTSSKESKFYSQSQHITSLQNSYDMLVKKQRDLIRDRGYIYNPRLEES